MPLAIPILDKVLLDFVNASLLDNLCDRAHYVFTTVLLFYFSILIAGKQMFGEPIRCMTPAVYKGEWWRFAFTRVSRDATDAMPARSPFRQLGEVRERVLLQHQHVRQLDRRLRQECPGRCHQHQLLPGMFNPPPVGANGY